jgi:hypothetical protein
MVTRLQAVGIDFKLQLTAHTAAIACCLYSVSDSLILIAKVTDFVAGSSSMFQVIIVAKVSSGTHLAVTSQIAQCDTKEQADALCDSVEKQNKESRALPGFSAATIKLYKV